MQLIEIIQLTLLFFVALSAIIFLFSYLGYRTKFKLKLDSKPVIDVEKAEIKESNIIETTEKNPKIETKSNPAKQNPRFEVFKPESEDKFFVKSNKLKNKTIHTPHTLFIKK